MATDTVYFMTSAYDPTNADPDVESDGRNISLFVNREDDIIQVKNFIDIIFGKGRIAFVSGEAGVGKSILARRCVKDYCIDKNGVDGFSYFHVCVDITLPSTWKNILVRLIEDIVNEADEDETIGGEALSFIRLVLGANTVTISDMMSYGKSISADVEVETGMDFGIIGFIKGRLGIKQNTGFEKQEMVEEKKEVEFEVNESFLSRLLESILCSEIKQKRKYVLLFDNLDQLENQKEIDATLRGLERLRALPSAIVVTIRREYISKLNKYGIFHRPERMNKRVLIEIYNNRKKLDNNKDSKLKKEMDSFANKCADIVDGHPFTFLKLLESRRNMRGNVTSGKFIPTFLKDNFSDINIDDSKKLYTFYKNKNDDFLLPEELKRKDIEALLRHRILIPDNIDEPRKYAINPFLRIFELES